MVAVIDKQNLIGHAHLSAILKEGAVTGIAGRGGPAQYFRLGQPTLQHHHGHGDGADARAITVFPGPTGHGLADKDKIKLLQIADKQSTVHKIPGIEQGKIIGFAQVFKQQGIIVIPALLAEKTGGKLGLGHQAPRKKHCSKKHQENTFSIHHTVLQKNDKLKKLRISVSFICLCPPFWLVLPSACWFKLKRI